MADTVKVLLSGDVNGNFSSLLNRVANVNKLNGPFDVLLCTGNFLPPAGEHKPSHNECSPGIVERQQIKVYAHLLGSGLQSL